MLRMMTIFSSLLLRREGTSMQIEGRVSWMKWKMQWINNSSPGRAAKGKASSRSSSKRSSGQSDPLSTKEEALKRQVADLKMAADIMEASFFEERTLHNATCSKAMEAERRESELKRRANALSREMQLKEEEINAMKISREEGDKAHPRTFSLLERERDDAIRMSRAVGEEVMTLRRRYEERERSLADCQECNDRQPKDIVLLDKEKITMKEELYSCREKERKRLIREQLSSGDHRQKEIDRALWQAKKKSAADMTKHEESWWK
jgi:hypothetical protein